MATHEAVFDEESGWSGTEADRGERPAADAGKTVGIDATTLEANAALRSIVRGDSEQGYEEFLMELAKASEGIETPRREDLAKLDRKRTGKGSNRVWKHPHDAGCADYQNEGRAGGRTWRTRRSMQWIWRPERLSR